MKICIINEGSGEHPYEGLTSTPQLNQLSIDVIVRFLKWALLQANPKKCISFASKKFDPRFVPRVDYERYGSTIYCPYNPDLEIDGEKLKFIVNVAADPTSLQFDHFKELGRWISVKIKSNQKFNVDSDRTLTLLIAVVLMDSANCFETSTLLSAVFLGFFLFMIFASLLLASLIVKLFAN